MEAAMKYLILINGNAQSRAKWESFTDEQRDWLRGIVEFMNESNAELEAAG